MASYYNSFCAKAIVIFICFFFTCLAEETKECEITDTSHQQICPQPRTQGNFSDLNVTIPTEKETAESHHVLGVTPLHYKWRVKYLIKDAKKFTGSLSVVLKVVKSTKRILINAFDLEITHPISLLQCGTNEKICPVKVAIDNEKQWIMIEFANELTTGKEYLLFFEGYRGKMGHWTYNEETSAGLWRNDYKSDSWATASIFQMRSARKAFPCFDHPSLKATFDICVTHDEGLMVLSNTEAEDIVGLSLNCSIKFTSSNCTSTEITHCFKRTPKMPTYVVTFSVLANFSVITDDAEQPKLEIIFSNKDDPAKYQWQIGEARKILKFFKDEVGLTYNLTKLALLNLSPVQFWGIENFGLVSIESGTPLNMYNREEMIHRILVHEIVHQWLGNVATISFWNEICLQEGLTAFLEWTVTARLKLVNGTFEQKATQTLNEVFNTNQIEMIQEPIVDHYSFTQGIANYCFSRPPVILNMIAEMWGKDLWLKFIKQYVDKFAYSNANFEDWTQLLNSVANTTKAGDVLHSWFYDKGEPIVYAKLLSPTTIQFQQKMYYGYDYSEDGPPVPEKGFTIPYKVLTKDGILNEIVVIYGKNATVTLSHPINGAFIMDPNSVTFTRKLYSPENYLNIFKCYGNRNTTPCFIPDAIFNNILNQFYRAIAGTSYSALLPWNFVSEKDTNKQAWLEVFDYLREISINGALKNKHLNCAALVKEKNDVFDRECRRDWNYTWSRSVIMQLLGRNYTFPNEKTGSRPRQGP